MRNSDGYRWRERLATRDSWLRHAVHMESPTKPSVTQAILRRLEWNMTASISKVKSSIEKKTCCKI